MSTESPPPKDDDPTLFVSIDEAAKTTDKLAYHLDFLFTPLHTALDFVHNVFEILLNLFLKVFMTKPVQFTAGVTTGILCLMLIYQLVALFVGLFIVG